jgi:hypothetical protein
MDMHFVLWSTRATPGVSASKSIKSSFYEKMAGPADKTPVTGHGSKCVKILQPCKQMLIRL